VSRKTADYKPVTAPVDVKTQIAHSLYLARAGVRGLVILGSTGEAVHLSGSERRAILSGVRKALNDEGLRDYPIMVGTTSAQNTVDVLELLKEAKDAGADYGLVLVPGYNATVVDQDGINAWFQEIAGQSPLPILV
jgi:2-keto-3-deoxy-L-rhamnonate aldolase